MTGFVPRKFRERSAVVEAVQLTDDADWDAIAAWCRGVHRVDFDVTGEACSRIVVPGSIADAYAGDWIAASYDSRWCEPFVVFTSSDPDQDFEERFEQDTEAKSTGLRVVSTAAELRRLADEVERTHDRAILEDRHWMAWTIREADVTHGRVRAVIYGHLTQVMCEEIDDAWASERGPWRVLHGPEATP